MEPKIYKVNLPLPKKFSAITVPPLGIFIRGSWWETANTEKRVRLRRHELTHWRQYRERGVVEFYWDYVRLWIRYGYDRHPMELEARQSE